MHECTMRHESANAECKECRQECRNAGRNAGMQAEMQECQPIDQGRGSGGMSSFLNRGSISSLIAS
jgi:hypothetical protein